MIIYSIVFNLMMVLLDKKGSAKVVKLFVTGAINFRKKFKGSSDI